MRFLRTVLLLVASLSLTAFSCSKKKTIGDPYMLFEVHGTVYGDHKVADESTPQEGDSVLVTLPVKGIRVTSGNSEAVYTGSDGSFVIYGLFLAAVCLWYLLMRTGMPMEDHIRSRARWSCSGRGMPEMTLTTGDIGLHPKLK